MQVVAGHDETGEAVVPRAQIFAWARAAVAADAKDPKTLLLWQVCSAEFFVGGLGICGCVDNYMRILDEYVLVIYVCESVSAYMIT